MGKNSGWPLPECGRCSVTAKRQEVEIFSSFNCYPFNPVLGRFLACQAGAAFVGNYDADSTSSRYFAHPVVRLHKRLDVYGLTERP